MLVKGPRRVRREVTGSFNRCGTGGHARRSGFVKITLFVPCAVVAILVAACGESRQPNEAPTPTTAAPEPGSAQAEPPAVTASSAAATAPECKDLVKADPKTCRPGAVGDPNAR
jgi:hypothetical protein